MHDIDDALNVHIDPDTSAHLWRLGEHFFGQRRHGRAMRALSKK